MFTIRVIASFLVAFAAVAVNVDAVAIDRRNPNGNCNVAGQHCCNQVMSQKAAANQSAPGGLLPILIPNSDGDVGVDCTPIGVLGAGLQSQCKATPVCCSGGSQYNGVVNFGCSPISVL